MSPTTRRRDDTEVATGTSGSFAAESQRGFRSGELAPSPSPLARRKRILLAEDDADMRELLAWSLVDQGYQVVEVADGMDLCRRLADHLVQKRSRHFDLVISDIRMPGVTGLEVIRGLGELENVPPSILITAFGDRETHRQADEIGVSLLDKPFEIDELLARVRELLQP